MIFRNIGIVSTVIFSIAVLYLVLIGDACITLHHTHIYIGKAAMMPYN